MKNGNPLSRSEISAIVGGVEHDIRRYRAEKCYNQDFMATRLGISQSMYFKIESGLVKITMERLKQIADILEKPLDAFLEKEKYDEDLKKERKIYISFNEVELMQKTITHLEKRVEELEAKILRRDNKIEELKLKRE